MTVSLHKMSAGKGYQYLLRSVVAGDGNRSLATPLTRYYSEAGTPPGYWLGSGITQFGAGELTPGAPVTEQQLQLLIGMGRDPLLGIQLGEPYRRYATKGERVTERVDSLNPHLSDEERAALVDEIDNEESAKQTVTATAGFDCTFSVPKSVSVLWGVSDAGTQALILQAHHEAVADVLDLLEREVAATRTGVHGRRGAVLQKDVMGVAATAYDHWDSRAGDPQLHTHVVVSNKIRTLEDGKWRTLDGRPLYASIVGLSEHYNAVLADKLTGAFGLEWERRDRGPNRSPGFEIAGASEELIALFSHRSHHINEELERRIAAHVAEYGRRPSARSIVRMRADITVETRPPKHVRSLAELTDSWRERATHAIGSDANRWARELTTGDARGTRAGTRIGARGLLRADDMSIDVASEVAQAVIGTVSEKRATWRHWNLWAEASRQTVEWRFATSTDREAAVTAIVKEAKRISIALTPPDLATTPTVFRRDDGTSRFRPTHSVAFTSAQILDAEDRLLTHAEDRTAPIVDLETIEQAGQQEVLGHLLSAEQIETLARVAVSGRQLDLLVGPAGAGKTTAMRALRNAWTTAHGRDSVVGLAPSAAAADVLAHDLGLACDNTAKWLHEHDHGRADFQPGQLVIVDEATLAGTLTLDRITTLAADTGAKVLLVGDWAQLQSVDAGGAFSMLAEARDDTPELTEAHRFTHDWERAASLDLRVGNTRAISTYVRHDRVQEGTGDDMREAAYTAWRTDLRTGRSSILVTESAHEVTALNERARADRIIDGETQPSREVELHDHTRASTGDLVITRRNDRRLRSLRGAWVHNGDRWRITDVLPDGTITVHRLGHAGGSVTLPAHYVAEHVELGYAVTAHRAQGLTLDSSHVVVTSATTRENLYVAMTRGSSSNLAYVALDDPDDSHTPPTDDEVTGATVLYGVLKHTGTELSAHQTIAAEQEHWGSFTQIAAEYLTIAAEAQRDRWITELQEAGLTSEQVDEVVASDSFGPLTAELRRLEASGSDVATLLPRTVQARSLIDADDIGAVLTKRLRRSTPRSRRLSRDPHLIAGLIPIASGPMPTGMAEALAERQELLEQRATGLAEDAVERRDPWTRRLGEPPRDAGAREHWMRHVRTVAAYRDRYDADSSHPIGDGGVTDVQRLDAARARQAMSRALESAEAGRSRPVRQPIGPPTLR